MTSEVSVAMTAATADTLMGRLLRADGQEDLCLATYRPSTGATRTSALLTAVVPPEPGDRQVHGNATIKAEYVLRAAGIAQGEGCGLVLLHSHPGAVGWQAMSEPDRDAESSYANLVRELTGLPLVGMTLAGRGRTWSARHWNVGVGKRVACTHATNVRVIGERLAVSWNDALCLPPRRTQNHVRTVSCWGERHQADLARRRILVVGAGSVGLDVVVRLAASGLCHLTVMDFDVVEDHNLDRLIGATRRDARLVRPKIHVARREAIAAATAQNPHIDISNYSVCEPDGLRIALDHDLIFCCVDRPWPRSVLNALAYTDLIPVIDGGIAIDTFDDGTMRNATWRSHVIRPGRPCMSCNRQLDLSDVMPDKQGLRDDPTYIVTADRPARPSNQNVAALSISASAGLLAQYVSFSVAPGGFGDPGPIQYTLSTHHLEHLAHPIRPECPVEAEEAVGDQRTNLTDRHEQAEDQRELANSPGASIRLLRWIDDRNQAVIRRMDRTPTA